MKQFTKLYTFHTYHPVQNSIFYMTAEDNCTNLWEHICKQTKNDREVSTGGRRCGYFWTESDRQTKNIMYIWSAMCRTYQTTAGHKMIVPRKEYREQLWMTEINPLISTPYLVKLGTHLLHNRERSCLSAYFISKNYWTGWWNLVLECLY